MRKCDIFAFSIILKANLYPCVCACFGEVARTIIFIPQEYTVKGSTANALLLVSALFFVFEMLCACYSI